MADSVCNKAATRFAPQSKLMEISALPRLVVERTLRTPGTERIACSTGVVTSMAMRSAGRFPASKDTTTRGKSTCGNKLTGRLKLLTSPATPKAVIKNRIERWCDCTHLVKFIGPTPLPRPCRPAIDCCQPSPPAARPPVRHRLLELPWYFPSRLSRHAERHDLCPP